MLAFYCQSNYDRKLKRTSSIDHIPDFLLFTSYKKISTMQTKGVHTPIRRMQADHIKALVRMRRERLV